MKAGANHVPDWDNLGSDIRGTAMIIDALTRVDPENALLPNAVGWLMVARTADHWPTGQENAWSILALSDWMAASGELNVDYDYKVAVNGRGLSEGHFDQENVTESAELAIAMASAPSARAFTKSDSVRKPPVMMRVTC